jgi:hypothetical protein
MSRPRALLDLLDVCRYYFPEGLSITWEGKHVWPSKYRPDDVSWTDSMKYTVESFLEEEKYNHE